MILPKTRVNHAVIILGIIGNYIKEIEVLRDRVGENVYPACECGCCDLFEN